MPDQTPGSPFNFDALGAPSTARPAAPPEARGFNFEALVSPAPATPAPTGGRSVVGAVLDAALTPVISQERARQMVGAHGALPDVPVLGTVIRALKAAPAYLSGNMGGVVATMQDDPIVGAMAGVLQNTIEEPRTIPAMVKGFGQGAVEGASTLTDPVSLAGFLTMGVSRAIARPLLQGIRALSDAERALVAARLRSAPLPVIARLRGELDALRSSAEAHQAVLRFARAADVTGSGVVTAQGVRNVANADTLPEAGAGVFQAALGAAGAKTATRVPDLPTAGPRHLAELPPHREARVTPPPSSGPRHPGPAEAAQPSAGGAPRAAVIAYDAQGGPIYASDPAAVSVARPVRGALPPGPGFVADDRGVIAALDQLDAAMKQAGRGTTPAAGEARGGAVPARVMDREFDGAKVTRRIYSSDPSVIADAPKVQMTPRERVELQRIAKELEYMPFTSHTFREVPVGHGGALEITPGGAGAPVYQDIIALGGSGSRAEVLDGINRFLGGEHNAAGQRGLDVARGRLQGDPYLSRPKLPEDAGVRNEALSGEMSGEDFSAFSAMLDDMSALGPSGEPGERGSINPLLLQRVGGGAAGAAAGYASGDEDDTTADRLQRAAAFGVAGAVAPSLFNRRGPGGTVLRGGARPTGSVGAVAGSPDLPMSGRPAPAPETPLRDPLANVDPFIQKFPEEMRGGLRQILADAGGFEAQRRGAVDQEQVGRLAEQVKIDLQRRAKVGTSANAEQIAQHVNAVATSQAKVRDLSERVARGQNSDTDILALEQARAQLNTVLATTMGLRAEAGRALAQFRSLARVLDSGNLQVVGEAAERLRGDAARFAAEFGKQPNDPVARYRWLQSRVTPSTLDRARQYYYSSILSGPKTHERNFLGNAANVLTNLAVTPVAVAADAARSAITGAPRSVFLGELPHQVVGAVLGVERGLSDALFSLKHGVNRSALTHAMSAAEAGKLDMPRTEFAGGLANPFNVPGRMLDAADQLFRGIAKNQELYGAAYAQAKREGKRGQALTERIADLRTGTSPEAQQIQDTADAFGRRSVFQEQGGPLVGLTQAAVKQFPPLTFVVPFIKTPANIFRQGFEFSPAGFGMKAVRAAEGRPQSQGLGRAAVGTALLAPLAWLAATGRMSGSGPSSQAERAQLMESGWRPNSVKVGDKWVSYSLFQPVSVQAGIVANAFEAWKAQGEKTEDVGPLVGAAVLKAMRSGLDQSFLSGLSDLFEAVNGFSMDSAARYGGRLAHSLTPFSGAQRGVQQAIDPVVRAPEGMADTFLASVPGQSKEVPARQTRFGQDIVREGGPAKRALDPFNVSTESDDPVLRMLDELQVTVGFPRAATLRGYTPKADEQRVIETAKGREMYAALSTLHGRPGFQTMTPERKRRAVDDARERASRVVTSRALALVRGQQPITVDALVTQEKSQ